MNIARFSVTRPVAVTMRIASLVLLGAICFTRLPIDLLPDITIPTVAVSTSWPNVAPQEIETQITRPLEETLSTTPHMRRISSFSSEGGSFIRIEFQWGTDIGQAAVDVLQLVQRAQRRFPDDPTIDTPTVFKFDPSQQPILVYGVTGINDPVKLRTVLDNDVAPILESADGVASAVVSGGAERAVMVNVDPVRLRARNLSLNDVVKRIAQENLNLPAGIARQSDTEFSIRTVGWFGSVADIAKTPVGSFNGQLVPLGDVASITDSHDETRMYTRLNGQPAAGIVISKQSGGNTVKTAQSVADKLHQVTRDFPQLHFHLAYDQAKFIEHSVNDVKMNAILGGILAVLILLFFLRNIKSTLVVALSIPISIISTFALLYVCGFTINTMSLGGLALATGLIVDDAVVVLENIFRHIERDKKRAPEAAVSGTNEIATAVLSSTLTIMVVFLPLLLIKGQAGQMFTQFALVVIFSIAVSLLDALTVVPMLASRLISGEAHRENLESDAERGWLDRVFHRVGVWLDGLDAAYRTALQWTLRHRWQVLSGAVGVTLASFLLLPLIGVEMMPKTDSGDFQVRIKLPVGTALATTNATMKRIEGIVNANPNVQTAFAAAGTTLSTRGTTTRLRGNTGSLTVTLKPGHHDPTESVMKDIRGQLSALPGVQASVYQYDIVSSIMSGGNPSVDINIFGGDMATLNHLAREVKSRVSNIPGYTNVDLSAEDPTPELQWTVDRDKALQLGVNFTDVANTINAATNGSIASYYHEAGFQYPIIVELPVNDRRTVEAMKNLVVIPAGASRTGQPILLRQVARATFALGPSEIDRLDRQRYMTVTGSPEGRTTSDIQADVTKQLANMSFPQGYHWDWGVRQQERDEEFAGMGLAIVLAIGLIYMLLASQFESFVHPLTIILSVPLCASGVILALFLTNRAFGLTALIGILMLVGIVVKNGILLVDYTNVLRGRGVPRDEAVLRAGPTRLRPILMTASATVLGMLPLAIGLGEGSETQAPMATAVCGGLITSTILTLFVVPTVYTLFDDLGRRMRGADMDLAAPELVPPSIEAVEVLP